MPARDKYHDTVVRALEKAGWDIARDQVLVSVGNRHLWMDLKVQKEDRIIYVEIKSFEVTGSIVDYLYSVIGQYLTYKAAIDDLELGGELYLAIPQEAVTGILSEPLGILIREQLRIKWMTFDIEQEEIDQWQPTLT